MSFFRRTLIIQNKLTNQVVHTREEFNTNSAARITKPLFQLLTDGNHIAFYKHKPNKLRNPQCIKNRYYVKP